jgi:hypothetical protein
VSEITSASGDSRAPIRKSAKFSRKSLRKQTLERIARADPLAYPFATFFVFKGKPTAKWGRKASDLTLGRGETAELPR